MKKKNKKTPFARNELHFATCLASNVAYTSKDKTKIIPRKQKYKKIELGD